MDQKGRQSINCSVDTCKFNEQSEHICNLTSIQIAPLVQNADSPDESICESFKRKE